MTKPFAAASGFSDKVSYTALQDELYSHKTSFTFYDKYLLFFSSQFLTQTLLALVIIKISSNYQKENRCSFLHWYNVSTWFTSYLSSCWLKLSSSCAKMRRRLRNVEIKYQQCETFSAAVSLLVQMPSTNANVVCNALFAVCSSVHASLDAW